jgi:RNA polymerase sigma factor (TIGR02999 family)
MEGDVTKLLNAISRAEAVDSDQLLQAVYDELRQSAAQKLARERPGNTLDATALVHEVYLRLGAAGQTWANRRHFFAAAAEAMRRILIESARRKRAIKRGGQMSHVDLQEPLVVMSHLSDDIVAVDEALAKLEAHDDQAAQLVKLRYFAGLTIPQVADALQVSPRTADRIWAFARAWLHQEIYGAGAPEE